MMCKQCGRTFCFWIEQKDDGITSFTKTIGTAILFKVGHSGFKELFYCAYVKERYVYIETSARDKLPNYIASGT